MTHTSTEQPEALRLADICATKGLFAVEDELRRLHAESEQHLQELRSYRITVENREAQITELEADIERLRKLHKDAYQRGYQAGSKGLREVYDAVQEVKHQDAWGNAQLTEALIAAEARIAELEAQLIAEAARTAEQKLRADQLEQQHDMQAKMHAQAAEKLAAAQVVPHTKVRADFYWVPGKQHHVPTLLIEFEPVPAGEPCDAKGWTDRDNLAAALAAAPQPPEAESLMSEIRTSKPEAAPVQLQESISKVLEDCRSRAIDYATCPSPYNNTCMETAFQSLEHQVRQLLAAHGIGKDKA